MAEPFSPVRHKIHQHVSLNPDQHHNLFLNSHTSAQGDSWDYNPTIGSQHLRNRCLVWPAAMNFLWGGGMSSDKRGLIDYCCPSGQDGCGTGEEWEGDEWKCPFCWCYDGQFPCLEYTGVPDRQHSVYSFEDVGCNGNG